MWASGASHPVCVSPRDESLLDLCGQLVQFRADVGAHLGRLLGGGPCGLRRGRGGLVVGGRHGGGKEGADWRPLCYQRRVRVKRVQPR